MLCHAYFVSFSVCLICFLKNCFDIYKSVCFALIVTFALISFKISSFSLLKKLKIKVR